MSSHKRSMNRDSGTARKAQKAASSKNPFQCGLCSMTFDLNLDLVTHVFGHDLSKPFQCGVCQTGYDNNPDLVWHMTCHKIFIVLPVPSSRDGYGKHEEREATLAAEKCGPAISRLNTRCTKPGTVDRLNEESNDSCIICEVEDQDEVEMSDTVYNRNSHDAEGVGHAMQHGKGKQDDEYQVNLKQEKERVLDTSAVEVKQPVRINVEMVMKPEPGCSFQDYEECEPVSLYESQTHNQIVFIVRNEAASGSKDEKSQPATSKHVKSPVPEKTKTTDLTRKLEQGKVSNNKWKCVDCGKIFGRKCNLKDHYRNRHMAYQPFACPKCPEKFKLKHILNAHIKKYHRSGFVPQAKIVKSYTKEELDRKVEEGKISENEWKCLDCGKILTWKGNLRCHYRQRHMSDRPFACPHCPKMGLCPKTFKLKRLLKGHIKRQHGIDPTASDNGLERKLEQGKISKHEWKCLECGKVLRWKAGLKVHYKLLHMTDRPFACPHCHKTFKIQDKLTRHVKHEHESKTHELNTKVDESQISETEWKCVDCGKILRCRANMKGHYRLCHMDDRPHACPECPKKFKVQASLKIHIKKHELGTAPVLKNYTGEDLKSKADELNSKLDQGKISENEWKCLDCDKIFKWKANLKDHYRLCHMDDRPYACPECPKAFKLSSTMRSHVRNMHGSASGLVKKKGLLVEKEHILDSVAEQGKISDTEWKCRDCDKTFSWEGGLREHYKLFHLVDQPFACSLCSRAFRMKTSLNVHLKRTHNLDPGPDSEADAEKIPCTVCGKMFIQSYLKRHMLLHEDKKLKPATERRFTCEVCGQSYHRQDYLKFHLNTHLNVKPIQCSVCGKRFTFYQSLWNHMRIHSGYKPHSCKTCGRSFINRAQLNQHSVTHGDSRPYVCVHCQVTYRCSSALYWHLKHKHGGAKNKVGAIAT